MYDRLPERIRRLAVLAYRAFLRDPNDPMLHIHELDATHRGQHRPGSRSVRINLQYRALYVEDGGTNVWYWIGSHGDYDTLTGRK